MKSIFSRATCITLIMAGSFIGMTWQATHAQSSSEATTPPVPLNLDARDIAREISKEAPVDAAPEKIGIAPNKMDDSFSKAEKHGLIPAVVEINTAGAPERVTKVTGAAGTYCVYAPTVGRTDGVDDIQNGEQTQVRTCPN